jgi:T4-like virus tail tube protein gp19
MPAVKLGDQSGGQVLELDDVSVGSLQSFAGGDAFGVVAIEKVGADGIVHKHLGDVKYEDISITCGAGMATSFYDWLQQTLSRNFSRKNGAIVTYDPSGNEISRLSFFNALLTEVGFLPSDASSKDLATLSIKITPESTTRSAGSSKVKLSSPNSKNWLISNFRLQVDGLDFSGTSRIEAITVSQSVVSNSVGETRDYQVEPAYLVVPDLTVTVADDQRNAALYEWYESFVIGGNSAQGQEKNGTLEYLSSDLKTTLFTLDLKQLGIFRMAPLTGTDGQTISRIQTSMYCEQMLFSYGSTAATASPQPVSSAADGQTDANQNTAAVPASGGLSKVPLLNPGNLTPLQGPRNLPPQQERVILSSLQAPRTAPSLRFRT